MKQLYSNKIKIKKITNKLIGREIRFVVTGGWEGELDEGGQKVRTSSCKINKYRDVMYNIINKITPLYVTYESCLRVNPKSAHFKEKTFF